MNIGSIKSDTRFLCGSTSGTYSDTDLVRNVNIAYHDVARLIWDSADGWNYDDSNASTLPVAKTTLVHNQSDYSLPSTAQRVHRVEVKDSQGNWLKLVPIDQADVKTAMPEFLGGTLGTPIYYDLVGRSVTLYPTPHSGYVTTVSGMAVHVDRDVTEFAVTATTTTPGFATPFHRILSYSAALDFEQDNQQREFLAVQKRRMEEGLARFYSRRSTENPRVMQPASRKYWRQYT